MIIYPNPGPMRVTGSKKIERFRNLIARQRVHPRLWDFSYLYLKSNAGMFRLFGRMVADEAGARGDRCEILDVGCGFKPWAAFFPGGGVLYLGIDRDRAMSSADALASGDALPFAESRFDALIYSEVLEHTADLPNTLKEMRRVARDGALVFISSPFVFYEHGVPHDYQRLTRYYYRAAFAADEIVALRESNSSLATAIVSLNLFIESTPFSLLPGLKHVVYSVTNVAARVVDLAFAALVRLVRSGKTGVFYSMPLGYALIVRIRK